MGANPERKSGLTSERWSLWLSILAILISIGGFYFQFLHHSNRLYIAFVGGYPSINDSILRIDLVFINKGTETESILANYILVEKKKGYKKQLTLGDTEKYNLHTAPIVLKPGEQQYRQILVSSYVELDSSNMKEFNFSPNDTVEIYLSTNYINKSGYITSDDFRLGWAIMDSMQNLQKLRTNYDVFRLKNRSRIHGAM